MIRLETPHTPESVGYDSSRLETLHGFFQKLMDRGLLRGASYAAARDGKLFAAGALGRQSFRDEDQTPLRPDTIFRIASITKLFTAAAVMTLVEDGIIRLDESMRLYFPEMAEFPWNTIAQVISHTGGIPADPESYLPEEGKVNVFELIEKELESGGGDWISAALSAGAWSEPGTRWEYSSLSFMLLGELVTRVSGMDVHRYIEERLLAPCGMNDSGFWSTIKKHPEIKSRLSVWDQEMEDSLNNPDKPEGRWANVPATGGGLYSTVTDMVRFGSMLVNGGRIDGRRVMGRKTIEKMTSVHSELPCYCWGMPGVPRPYGLGPDMHLGDMFLCSRGTFYHEGWGWSRLSMDPKEKLVTAYFTPFVKPDQWDPLPVYNPQAILNSGLI